MTAIAWNAEGGSDGTLTSTANSGGGSGTAWDTCQRGTSATNEYDSATAAAGSLSVLLATGGTSTMAFNRWSGALTALWASGLTTHYGRIYFRLAGLPAANRAICEFLDATLATNRANIQILTTGAIRLRNAANGTVATTATLISLNTWYRLEYRIDGSTTGAYELHLYAGSSTTALEDIVGGTANFGGAIGAAGYGYVSNGANLASLWFDGIQINDVALPGPEASGQTVAIGQVSETDTANANGRAKTKGIGQSTETDTATSSGRLKARAAIQASETDTAGAFGRLKATSIGQATSTETAGALEHPQAVGIGQATESDVAQAAGRLKTAAPGQPIESDLAQPLQSAKRLTIGMVLETAAALPMGRSKALAVGRALEADAAQPVSRAQHVPVGMATETDTALALELPAGIPARGTPLVRSYTGTVAARPRTGSVVSLR